MMSESHEALPGGTDGIGAASPAAMRLDWHEVADQRLARLVELEHDHAVMCDRLELLQVDWRQMLVVSEERLQRIVEQDRERSKMECRLAELARESAAMHATFVNSRSWRLTRPLRVVSGWWMGDRRSITALLRAMLRVPLVRRGARFVVRWVPGLHGRMRARLYPQGAKIGREDLH